MPFSDAAEASTATRFTRILNVLVQYMNALHKLRNYEALRTLTCFANVMFSCIFMNPWEPAAIAREPLSMLAKRATER